jgi:Domain of unknown function (DUF4349)
MRQRPTQNPRRSSPTGTLICTGLFAALVTLLAGCDAGSTKGSASSAVENAGATPGATEAAGHAYGMGQGEAAAASASAAPMSLPAAMPSPSASAATSSTGDSGSTPPLLANRDVIYTADITVRAPNIKQAVSSVESLVANHGGLVFAEEVDLAAKDPNNPGEASATITLKVPPDQLTATLNDVGAVGTEISRNENSDDVTQKVVDVNARINAARASIARLTDLLSHTGSVADLLNVENQLSQRDSDLESLEQQQKSLAAQTSMATITVHLQAMPPVAKAVPKPKQAHVFGFLRGLRGGWHAFTKAVSGFATAVGAMLPFLAVLALIGLAVVIGRRRLARTRRVAEPPAPVEQS